MSTDAFEQLIDVAAPGGGSYPVQRGHRRGVRSPHTFDAARWPPSSLTSPYAPQGSTTAVLEQPGRTREGRTRPVSDARAQQVANDPVTNLFRERSKATAPGLAKEVWVGVDTHKDVNVAAAVDESGRPIGGDQPASISASTTPEGNSDLLAWARGLGETVVAFAVEGTGSSGASLTRFLQAKGQIVVEATRPKREDKAVRRTLGKSDAIDALLAAQRLHRLELRISPSPASETWSACACCGLLGRRQSRLAPRPSTR